MKKMTSLLGTCSFFFFYTCRNLTTIFEGSYQKILSFTVVKRLTFVVFILGI